MNKIVFLVILLIFIFDFSISQNQNDNALFQLGQQYERATDIDNALKIYKSLYEKYPNNYNFYDSYRKVLEYLKKYTEAIPIIEKWIVNNPNDIAQLGYLGNDYMRLNNVELAKSIWEKAVNINPQNINIYRTLASVILEGKYYEQALEIYLRGRESCRSESSFILEIATIYAILNNYDKSITEYLKLLEGNPVQLGYIQSLFVSYVEDPAFIKNAIEILKEKIKKGKNDISFYYLLSWLYGEQKNYNDALFVYVDIEKIKKTNGIELFNFAEKAFRDKAYDVASKAYRTIIDEYPKSPIIANSKFGHARCMEEISNQKNLYLIDSSFSLKKEYPSSESLPLYSGVITLYESIIKEYPGSNWACESFYKIGDIKLEKFYDLDGSYDAFSQINKYCVNTPIAINALFKMGDILVLQNKLLDAIERYSSIHRYPIPGNNYIDKSKFKIAEINYFLGNFDIAIKLLEEIAKNISADYTNDALILLTFIQGNKTEDGIIFKQYAHAELLERQKKISEALVIFKSIEENFPESKLIDETYFKIASLECYLKNYDLSIKTFEELIIKFPDGLFIDKSLFFIAEIYQFGLKDIQKAISYYDRILKDFPNSLYVNKARKRMRELRKENI